MEKTTVVQSTYMTYYIVYHTDYKKLGSSLCKMPMTLNIFPYKTSPSKQCMIDTVEQIIKMKGQVPNSIKIIVHI